MSSVWGWDRSVFVQRGLCDGKGELRCCKFFAEQVGHGDTRTQADKSVKSFAKESREREELFPFQSFSCEFCANQYKWHKCVCVHACVRACVCVRLGTHMFGAHVCVRCISAHGGLDSLELSDYQWHVSIWGRSQNLFQQISNFSQGT